MDDYCKYQQRFMEAIPAQEVVQSPFLQGLNNLFSFCGLLSYWCQTFYGLKMQVALLQRQGQQIEALNLLLQGLSNNHFWVNHVTKWWYLMRQAVSIGQDLQLSAREKMCEPVQRLFKLSTQAPMPWQGFNVAYCFVSLSLWSFQFGKMQKALEQVNSAIHADPTWGYPEYLLGWYGLVLEGIEPVPHFVRAIQANWSFFQIFKQDPLCQQFPEVMKAVKLKVLSPLS